MSQAIDIQALVKRVVGRVFAEQGRVAHPSARPEAAGVERAAGVHVTIDGESGPMRPAETAASASADRRGPELVTVESLAGLARGASLRVGRGAIVTDLARDEAWRRGIQLVERDTSDRGRLRIAVASDHGGFKMKADVLDWVRGLGHDAFDLGTRDENAVDYPDYARAAAEAVAGGNADFAIVLDGAGIGSAMAANKVPGVRAANCWDSASAANAREHNFANVLTLGAKMLASAKAREIVRTFLTTNEGEERHAKRVRKIDAIERAYARGAGESTRTR